MGIRSIITNQYAGRSGAHARCLNMPEPMDEEDLDENGKPKKIRALDAGDIALLKTYVRARPSAHPKSPNPSSCADAREPAGHRASVRTISRLRPSRRN